MPPPYISRALGVASWYPILPAFVAFDKLLPNSSVLLSGSLTPPEACNVPAVTTPPEKAALPSTLIPALAVANPVKLEAPVTARSPVLLMLAVVRSPVLAVSVTIKVPVTRLGPLTSRVYGIPRKTGAKFDTEAAVVLFVLMSCAMIKRKYKNDVVCVGAMKTCCVVQS